MRFCSLLPLLLICAVFSSHGQDETAAAAVQPVIDKVVAAVGGKDKLLTLFRMKETFHFGANPTPDEGKKASSRESVLDAPQYWWIGKKERADEPAKYDVWAWTLGALVDPKSKIEIIPDLTHEGPPLFGLSVSGTIDPPMDLYFDKETNLLRRIGWRSDYYLFSDWKEHDGVKYASKTVIYKKATGKPWFFHEVTEVERLKELPVGLTRDKKPE